MQAEGEEFESPNLHQFYLLHMTTKTPRKVKSSSDFIEHLITLDEYNKAEEYKQKQIQEFGNHCTLFPDEKDDAKIKGGCGEIILMSYNNVTRGDANGIGYDLLYKNKKVEAKVQGCSSMPSPNFEGWMKKSQAETSVADLVVMMRALNRKKGERLKKMWICGLIPLDEFKLIAKLVKRGEMKSSYGSVKEDKLEVLYTSLYCPKDYFKRG